MDEPVWVERETVLRLHARTLALHGGFEGIRDEGLFESALTRPLNRFAYEPDCDLFDLAAAYAFGLALNHAFNDGNKRIAFITATLFLALNGVTLTAEPDAATAFMLELASGGCDEAQAASWFRDNSH